MKTSDVNTIAVIGLGKMGCDWAAQILEKNYAVIGYDCAAEALEVAPGKVLAALKWIEKNRKDREKKPIHPAGFAEECLLKKFALVNTEQLLAAGDFQVLLECIFEDLQLKRQTLHRIDQTLRQLGKDKTIYWSNTSSLDVGRMAQAIGNPGNLNGTHGMNPVYMMPAVEVVRHEETEERVLRLTLDLLTEMGKIPFVAANVPGFWVNHHLVPFMLEAYRALERGEITVEDGDKGLKYSLGHPQGVFLLSDFIGTPTMYRVAMAMYLATGDPRNYPPFILAKMFRDGEWGRKETGEGLGFYEWKDGKPIAPRDFSDQIFRSTDTLLI